MKQNTLGYVIAFVVLGAILSCSGCLSGSTTTTMVQNGHSTMVKDVHISIDIPHGINQNDVTFSAMVYEPGDDFSNYYAAVVNERNGKTNDGHDYETWHESRYGSGDIDEGTFVIELSARDLSDDQLEAMTKSVKVLN